MILGNASLREVIRAGEDVDLSEQVRNDIRTLVPHGPVVRSLADAADRANVPVECVSLYLSRHGADLAAVWAGETRDDGMVPALGLMTTMTHRHGPKFFACVGDVDQPEGGVVYAAQTAQRTVLGGTQKELKQSFKDVIQWWLKRQAEIPALRRSLKAPLDNPGPVLYEASRRSAAVMDRRTPILAVYRAREVHLDFDSHRGRDYWSLALAFMRVEGQRNPKQALPRGLDFYYLLRDREEVSGGNAQADAKRLDRVRGGGRAGHSR